MNMSNSKEYSINIYQKQVFANVLPKKCPWKFCNIHRKTLFWTQSFFFKKKQRAWRPLTQVFSFKYCEIFKNTFFEEHLQTAASDLCNSRNRSSPPEVFLGVLKISSKITREYHAEEGVVRRCCYKFCKFHRKAPMLESPTQVFSCEIFEIFKNTFIYRTPPVATFEYLGFYQPSMMELFWKNS